jgi:indole-3-glycerol phosphate synthase
MEKIQRFKSIIKKYKNKKKMSVASKSPIFIAEIKTISPFGYSSKEPFYKLMELAIEHGDWISVHDNALWGGDYDSISFVRKHTDKPILAKGIHGTDDSIRMALEHGADYVLVVGRVPDSEPLKKYCLFEAPLDYSKLTTTDKIVFNSRDLSTGEINMPWVNGEITDFKKNKYEFICQASGISHINQVHPEADAFIVGQHLRKFVSSKNKLNPTPIPNSEDMNKFLKSMNKAYKKSLQKNKPHNPLTVDLWDDADDAPF